MVAIRVILFIKAHVVKFYHVTEIMRAALIRHGLPDKTGSPQHRATPRVPWSELVNVPHAHQAVQDPLTLPAPISYLVPNNVADTVTGPVL